MWLLLNSQDQLYALFAESLKLQHDAYEDEALPKMHLVAFVRSCLVHKSLHARYNVSLSHHAVRLLCSCLLRHLVHS